MTLRGTRRMSECAVSAGRQVMIGAEKRSTSFNLFRSWSLTAVGNLFFAS